MLAVAHQDTGHYDAHFTNTEPVILATTIAYDKGWVATDGNGNELSSFPIYGMVNGFYIEEPGNHNIVIKYKPQEFSQLGAALSTVGFLGAIVYLMIPLRARILLLVNLIREQKFMGTIPLLYKNTLAEHPIGTFSTLKGERFDLTSSKPKEKMQARFRMRVGAMINYPPYNLRQSWTHGQLIQMRSLMLKLLRTDSSNFPILIGIALMFSVAILVPLESTYANLLSAYGLGCLAIGLIWRSVFANHKAEPVLR
jgi:hypothetical protein